MRSVRRQEAEDATFGPVCASLLETSSKDYDSEGAAVVKHPLSGGDCARNQESGSVKRSKAKTSSLDSSHDVESSVGDESSSSSIS